MHIVNDKCKDLQRRVEAGENGATAAWQGVDFVMIEKDPELSDESFYPGKYFVESRNVNELSWLHEQLRDFFSGDERYWIWNKQFFGSEKPTKVDDAK
jgi:hypothetical protein